MKQGDEELFDDFANTYDREVFTQGTLGECDFIEKEINFDKTLRILDIGCGTGRHSIELSGRGYTVTGIDLSELQLQKAREKAASAGQKIEFKKHDARDPHYSNAFDLVIMLCEGGFRMQ